MKVTLMHRVCERVCNQVRDGKCRGIGGSCRRLIAAFIESVSERVRNLIRLSFRNRKLIARVVHVIYLGLKLKTSKMQTFIKSLRVLDRGVAK